jgi:myo-inositol-1(or 4)-monophosphatase
MTTNKELLSLAIEAAQMAGSILCSFFGKAQELATKESISSIVTEADIASEKAILSLLRAHRPNDSTIAEESGYQRGTTDITWVVDPLDGTSNFSASIPWFGVLIAAYREHTPLVGVAYLPTSNEIYSAIAGEGAFKNGVPIRVSSRKALKEVLWGYGADAADTLEGARSDAMRGALLIQQVRNLRTTNSLIDECYTADGRLGGFLNLSMKVWDFAPWEVILREAGGVITEFMKPALITDLTEQGYARDYAVLGGAPHLVDAVATLFRSPS